jgi:hypothetical protein
VPGRIAAQRSSEKNRAAQKKATGTGQARDAAGPRENPAAMRGFFSLAAGARTQFTDSATCRGAHRRNGYVEDPSSTDHRAETLVKSRDPTPTTPAPDVPPARAAVQAPASGAAEPRRSGRVQFDSRGQAVWEWAVKTGMFDRNASTQRIKALVETPLALSEEPKPAAEAAAKKPRPGAARPSGGDPYERAAPLPRPGEHAGFNPYDRAPTKPRKPQR